jgi:hypothetical protein
MIAYAGPCQASERRYVSRLRLHKASGANNVQGPACVRLPTRLVASALCPKPTLRFSGASGYSLRLLHTKRTGQDSNLRPSLFVVRRSIWLSYEHVTLSVCPSALANHLIDPFCSRLLHKSSMSIQSAHPCFAFYLQIMDFSSGPAWTRTRALFLISEAQRFAGGF